ncbi:FMN-binding negative transcriptional regulator [Pseudaestuariivita atlantica]|uniref:Negative transcriptional regulator n=1 Tax=Pseudaestuariivita atlantica TaxID=1317121 RepID=A0A0L1JS36_9RHOB|nr:FMN-binding negative transcriptional regulator [Pseudaestuariivita atlantica]KNG94546.1 negative transcriptional regulator [Pseudaestuariivita atlantica]
MHPNPIFRGRADARNLDFARAQGFGALIVAVDGVPQIAQAPFLLSDDDAHADLHLLRSNPVWRALDEPRQATLLVTGAHGYISPDWYGIDDQVPTWNYVSVHLTGTLERLPTGALRDTLDAQSAHFEALTAPKPPWTTDKMPRDLMAKMMRTIMPLRLTITGIDGTWKLNQNKPDAARLSAADAVEAHGLGLDTRTLAALMRDPPEQESP